MSESSPPPIGSDGSHLVNAPAEGEWLVALAIPADADVPDDVRAAAEELGRTLGMKRGLVDPLGCTINFCGQNFQPK